MREDYWNHPEWLPVGPSVEFAAPGWAKLRHYLNARGLKHPPGTICRISKCVKSPISTYVVSETWLCDLHFDDGSGYRGLASHLLAKLSPLELLARV